MPFIDSSQSQRSVAHATDIKSPILIGLMVVVGLTLVMLGGNVVNAASGARFELTSSSQEATGITEENPVLEDKSTNASLLYVFVSGAVVNPGVYTLDEGARIGDAVELAGGFLEGAATEYNNLARVLVDGEQIHIPLQDELAAGEADITRSINTGTATASNAQSALVNINTASLAELETLPGVGPSTAKKIISSRESEGPFSTVDELMRVSGIGEKKYAALEGLICV